MVNLEGLFIIVLNVKEKKFVFKGKFGYVNILKFGSVEVVSIVNNYLEDYFEEGMKDI